MAVANSFRFRCHQRRNRMNDLERFSFPNLPGLLSTRGKMPFLRQVGFRPGSKHRHNAPPPPQYSSSNLRPSLFSYHADKSCGKSAERRHHCREICEPFLFAVALGHVKRKWAWTGSRYFAERTIEVRVTLGLIYLVAYDQNSFTFSIWNLVSCTCVLSNKWRHWIIVYRLYFGDRLCGLVVRVPGYRSTGPGSNTCATRFLWVVGLERSPLSLVSTIEELLERKSSGSGLEIREYGYGDPSRWSRGRVYPLKSALSSPTSGGRSVGIVRSWTKATEFFCLWFVGQSEWKLQAIS
jgi:hypothetical protein